MANDDSDITILHLLTFDFLATTRKYTLHQMCPCLVLFHHPSLFETVWVCVCAYDQCVIIRMSNMAAVASDFHFRSFFRIEDFLNEVFKLWQPKNTCSSRIANNIYILHRRPTKNFDGSAHPPPNHLTIFHSISFHFVSFFLQKQFHNSTLSALDAGTFKNKRNFTCVFAP